MAPLHNNFNNDNVVEKDDKLILANKYLSKSKFKKITGSRLSSVLGIDKYTSPFKAWLTIVNLYYEKMDDTLSEAGNICENKIREFVSKFYNTNFITYEPAKIGYDCFKENDIFGGIPDGEPYINNKIDYSTGIPMIEIKTTSIDKLEYEMTPTKELRMRKNENNLPIVKIKNGKKKEWFDDKNKIKIPQNYLFQLGLYLYLRNITSGCFAIGFLTVDDYLKPNDFDASEKIKTNDIKIATIQIEQKSFKKYIDYASDWYQKHVIGGESPTMSGDDKKWFYERKKIDNKN